MFSPYTLSSTGLSLSGGKDDGNTLVDGGWGRVEGREGAERSGWHWHAGLGRNTLLWRVSNNIVRYVTKQTTNICLKLLFQIGDTTCWFNDDDVFYCSCRNKIRCRTSWVLVVKRSSEWRDLCIQNIWPDMLSQIGTHILCFFNWGCECTSRIATPSAWFRVYQSPNHFNHSRVCKSVCSVFYQVCDHGWISSVPESQFQQTQTKISASPGVTEVVIIFLSRIVEDEKV